MPETTPQWQKALDAGNATRCARAAVKRDLKKGPRSEAWKRAATLLENPPPVVWGMELGDVLRATHGLGVGKTRYILARLHIGEGRKIGDLTDRQRLSLAIRLTEDTPIPRGDR